MSELILNVGKGPENLSMYLMAAWMFATALYILVSLIRRLKSENTFDRSMLGELNHALSMATYQVRLSQIMRWNILLIGALNLLGIWEGGQIHWHHNRHSGLFCRNLFCWRLGTSHVYS